MKIFGWRKDKEKLSKSEKVEGTGAKPKTEWKEDTRADSEHVKSTLIEEKAEDEPGQTKPDVKSTLIEEKVEDEPGQTKPASEISKGREQVVEEDKEARLKLYSRDDVRRFVGWVLRGNEQVRPQRSPESGEYGYSGSEYGLDNILPLLDELQSYKILQREVVDTTPACPGCEHTNFNVVFLCPYSQHTIIDRGNLIEHYSCGYADFESNFQSGNDLICPKCRRFLKVVGTDYRKVDRSYHCSGCGKYFGTPRLQLPCRVCGRVNSEDEMHLAPVYGYKINRELRGELITHCSLEAKIKDFFEKSGYTVTIPQSLPGLSGVTHKFDLGAKNEKEKKDIVLDMISATDEVGPQDVVAFFAKVYDAKPHDALLIALPQLGREALKLAAMYSVQVIAAKNPDEVIARLPSFLGQLSTETGAEQKTSISAPPAERRSLFVEQMVESLEKRMLTEQQKTLETTLPKLDQPKEGKLVTELKPPEKETADEILRNARARMQRVITE